MNFIKRAFITQSEIKPLRQASVADSRRSQRKRKKNPSRKSTLNANERSQDQLPHNLADLKQFSTKTIRHKQAVEKQEVQTAHLVLLLVCIYFVCGIVYYKIITGWTLTDAAYFAVTTFLSIGYGDMSISSSGQVFTAAYVLLGVGFIGTSIGLIMSDEEETKDKALHKHHQELEGTDDEMNFCIHKWEMDYYRKELLLSFLQVIIVVAVGTGVMCYAEGWDIAQAIYWAVVTITTTGFGDITPTTKLTKWFCIFYAPYGVIQVARSLAFIAQFPLLYNRTLQEEKLIDDYEHIQSMEDLKNEIYSSDEVQKLGLANKEKDQFDEAQFILSMLVCMEQVDIEDVWEWKREFGIFDATHSGFIAEEDFTVRKSQESKNGAPAV